MNKQDLLNNKINISARLPLPTSLSRNDPCLCGSGLKYKKCCLQKNENVVPKLVNAESFEIKTGPLTPEESGHNFSPISPTDRDLMETLYHTLYEEPDKIDSENCEYFQKLNALRLKYPDNPKILNYITRGYSHLGQNEQVKELANLTYEKFPDYLFAKTTQANIYLSTGFHEKAFEVLKKAHTLKQLYPLRTVFHIAEVKAFEHVMVKYFCMIGDLKQANLHLQIMQKILDEDDELLYDAQKIFTLTLLSSENFINEATRFIDSLKKRK